MASHVDPRRPLKQKTAARNEIREAVVERQRDGIENRSFDSSSPSSIWRCCWNDCEWMTNKRL